MAHAGGVVCFAVSLGVAQIEPEVATAQALFARADAALYEAKRRGRNRVVLASQA